MLALSNNRWGTSEKSLKFKAFSLPLLKISLRACRTLWSCLFTMPLENLKIDAPQNEFMIFILIQYSIFSDTAPFAVLVFTASTFT